MSLTSSTSNEHRDPKIDHSSSGAPGQSDSEQPHNDAHPESKDPGTSTGALVKVSGADKAHKFAPEGRDAFPLDALPKVLRDYAVEVCATRLVPMGLAAPAVLTAVSAAMGAGIEIETWEEKTTRGNLYWMGVASSGVGKGLVCDDTFAPNLAMERIMIESWREKWLPQVRAQERLIKMEIKTVEKQISKGTIDSTQAFPKIAALEQQLDKLAMHKIQPRAVCEDVTREKLGDLLATQPGEALASVSSEARGIMALLTRMGAEDIYTKAWSGESYHNDRRTTKQVRLSKPCLTVSWMIQDDAWKKLLGNESFVSSGLLPRFLISAPEMVLHPLPKTQRRFDPSVKSAYHGLMEALIEHHRHRQGAPPVVPTAPAIRSHFIGHENRARRLRSPGGRLQDIPSFAARWTQNAFRIALVLHVATHGSAAHERPLAMETALAALTIMEWFENQQVRLLTDRMNETDNKRADRLEAAIHTYGTGPATIRDLVNSNGFKETEIIALAEQRAERFRIVKHRKSKGTKGGRPSRAVELVNKFDGAIPFPEHFSFAGSEGCEEASCASEAV
jgi:hypothetical protein